MKMQDFYGTFVHSCILLKVWNQTLTGLQQRVPTHVSRSAFWVLEDLETFCEAQGA